MSLLDYLFPKHCVNCKKFGAYLCSNCFSYISFNETGVCFICERPAINGFTHPACKTTFAIDGVFSSLLYTGVVKKLIYKFKYRPHLTDLQTLLIDLFYEGIIQKEAFYRQVEEGSIFIPIPLHKTKLRKRGYNQSFLLAAGLGKKLSVATVDCLERIKNTPTQVGLSQKKRLENMQGAFTMKKALQQSVKQVFLVDDVATSGATLREAAKVLKRAGVEKVWGLTLAHGQ